VPPLPAGRYVDLPGRGTTFLRELDGPSGAPVVVLLHGWTATADLNWFPSYEPLAEHYRVLALDHRGHGRGLRTRQRFRLADCADDVAALCTELGVDQFIPVGYSMGGAVAQLAWKRHRDRVPGLVLCATTGEFASSRDERWPFLGMAGLGTLARVAPPGARTWLTEQFYLQRKRQSWAPWAIQEASLHDWRMILQAGGALGTFSSLSWLAEVDVPTSVVITLRDRIVATRRQIRMFEAIPGAEAFRVDGDHDACVAEADRFVPTLLAALASVTYRSRVTPGA
jgi:3-oxoadipate enol-lactonase